MTLSDPFAVREVVPRADLAYRPFLVASLLVGVCLGFALGLHVATVRLLDAGQPERTAELIQAHGQAQLLGFAGLYVIGMSLRLLPRFTGGSLRLGGLLPVVLWATVASLLLRAVVLPLLTGDQGHALLVIATFSAMAGSGAYLLVVGATLGFGARRADPAGTAFLLGALMLFAATAVATYAAIHEGTTGARTIPYLADTAVNQLLMYGFLFVTILGVALRALPVMVGRERPEVGAGLLPRVVSIAVAAHAAALVLLSYWRYSDALVAIADVSLIALGVAMLAFAWQAGVLRPRADRLRPASQTAMWLVRGAFFWLACAALLNVYFGARAVADVELIGQLELDAARHAFGVGLVTNLIVGMSMLILPEFAGERQGANSQRLLASVLAILINAAALLRVTPSLLSDTLSHDVRDLSMAIAGTLAEVAMLTFAVYLLRLMWKQRQQQMR